jgi:hypothetical protein
MNSIIRLISFTTFLVLKVIVTTYGSVLHSVGIARGVYAGAGGLRTMSIRVRLIISLLALLPVESLAIYKPAYVVLENPVSSRFAGIQP